MLPSACLSNPNPRMSSTTVQKINTDVPLRRTKTHSSEHVAATKPNSFSLAARCLKNRGECGGDTGTGGLLQQSFF
eukprot:699426-Rhodomonas_salina.1